MLGDINWLVKGRWDRRRLEDGCRAVDYEQVQ